MPERGEVLVEASYQVTETETGLVVHLNNIEPINAGKQYKPMIKKVMTGPFLVPETKLNPKLYRWEFLFIWVEEKDETK